MNGFRELAGRLIATAPVLSPAIEQDHDAGEEWLRQWRGERYATCRLSNYEVKHDGQRRAVDRTRQYLDLLASGQLRGQNLILHGRKGTGKDHLLAAAMRAAVMRGLFVRWRDGTSLQGKLRSLIQSKSAEETEDTISNSLCNCDILAISDPIGPSLEGRPFYLEWLYRIVDFRYSQMKPIWITINARSQADIEKMLTPQITDRLLSGAMSIPFDWESYR